MPAGWRWWGALGLYVALIYVALPLGPRVGLAVLRTGPGSWLLGPGLTVLALAGVVFLGLRMRRRGAPAWAYVALALAGVGYAVGFAWLRSQRLERTHLPEYGLAAYLAWRAVGPLAPGALSGYAAAALLGAAIGYGDELIQAVLPGRVYDLRDVALNAIGALLGIVVVAATRAVPRKEPLSAGSSARRSPQAAGSSLR
jgi:hypothetical protein